MKLSDIQEQFYYVSYESNGQMEYLSLESGYMTSSERGNATLMRWHELDFFLKYRLNQVTHWNPDDISVHPVELSYSTKPTLTRTQCI